MKWTSTNISEVITSNPVYFDSEKSNICARICNILFIDCFPDLDGKSYNRFVNDEWVRKPIGYDISGIDSAFDIKLLELYEKNDSNIVFTTNKKFVDGVIHFTNYENPNIYSNIYHNLNIFEKNLRSHLYEYGLSDNDFIEYLESYELTRAKKPERKKWLNKRVLELKKSHDKRPFEKTFLSELLDYSVSKYHSLEIRQKLGTSFLKKKYDIDGRDFSANEIIKKLRNFIMHHDNISGESIFTPHDFVTFKEFFNYVLIFKESFNEFRAARLAVNLHQIVNINRHRLEIIEKLDDSEVTKYFYS
jgi:hypothetical protein